MITALGLVFAVLSGRVRWATAFKQRCRHRCRRRRPRAGPYPGARPREDGSLRPRGKAYLTTATFSLGQTAPLALVGIPADKVPARARPAVLPEPAGRGITGAVWLDVAPGGGGRPGVVDPAESISP